ncbi:MAG TPA: 30S ribosomal protein S6 [Pyrinomonadaceae bacterium]|nr:30S ribosomal protein S6 [Pyrinomonadaceae bacterium]
MAEQRIYEVVFIVDPDTGEDEVTRLTDNLQHIITEQGGSVTKNELMGRRSLAYRIGRKTEGIYILFEVAGSGREIAELERRMRVSDQVLRYLTVRVDEDRRRAEKLKERRVRKASKRPGAAMAGAGVGSASRAPVGVGDDDD